MQTEYVSMTEDNLDAAAIARAGGILRGGGLVAFPTETVYGLGGDALNPESARKIYAAKGRPSDNPLIVHICRMEDVGKIAEEIPESFYLLAERFWPGPLTMILKKSGAVPDETTGGLATAAVRFPSNRIAQAVIRAAGGFVAAPSANRSGRPSPTLARYCREDLDGLVEMIIDGGPVDIGVESSIIDLSEEEPVLLRPGFITQEMLREVLGELAVDRTVLGTDAKERPRAPGMKYRHYAPRGELCIVEGEPARVTAYINRRAGEARGQGLRTGVICTDETRALYRADSVKSAGTREDEGTIARALFRILREFDDEGVQLMFSESFDESGVGMAVMNRLIKAAGHRIVRV